MICSIRNIDYFKYDNTEYIKEIMYDAREYTIEEMLSFKKFEGNIVYDLSNVSDSEVEEIISDCRMIYKAMEDKIRFRVKGVVLLDNFVKNGLPAFCYPRDVDNADTLDKFNIMCEKGATDVYVTGELGFKMKDVRELANRKKVRIRVVPNVAHMSGNMTFSHEEEETGLTAFWIRPNDLLLYEDYIDIVEFFCEDQKQHIFYSIYFDKKNWDGDLGEIVAGMSNLHNKGLISDFTEARINCGKKCLLDKCHSCFKYKRMSELIIENNLRINKKTD